MSDTSNSSPAKVARRWVELPEALLLFGAAVLLYGIWQVYRPASFIVCGLILMGLGLNILGFFTSRSKVN